MTDSEMDIFIEEMDHRGDHWEKEDVKRVYGDSTLEEALEDRKTSLDMFFDGFAKYLQS